MSILDRSLVAEVRRLLRRLDRDKKFKQPEEGTMVFVSLQRESDLRSALEAEEKKVSV